MIRIITIIIALLLAGTAMGQERFVCTSGDRERVISVVYLSDGPLPCEVTYDKGAGAEVLWSAEHTEGYCESRAMEFVRKQEGWGFDCTHYRQGDMEDDMGAGMDDDMDMGGGMNESMDDDMDMGGGM